MLKLIFKSFLHFISLCAIFVVAKAQVKLPPNSCPNYFKYTNGASGVEGQIFLKFRIRDSNVNLVFEGSIPEKLTSVSL